MMYLCKVIASIPLLIIGAVLGWILDLSTPRSATRWPGILNYIYGNDVDGIDGDAAYRQRARRRFLRRYRWCFLRNPLNNWLRRMGPNGTVWGIRHYKYGRISLTRCKVNGTPYFFASVHLFGPYHIWLGYRLFRDDRTGSALEEGHHLENTMLIPWIKKV